MVSDDETKSGTPRNGDPSSGSDEPSENIPGQETSPFKPSTLSPREESHPALTNIPTAPSGIEVSEIKQGMESHRMFAPNVLISGRYRILKFLGQGGMGEVYEAEDLDLRERVALKTIRPEIAEDRKVIDQFKREIQLSRRITHPNVCRIFDLGYHRQEGRAEITFLTMEFLSGETLSQRLRRSGRVAIDEALPLVTQMVAGLSAAHEAGIVHRDFKPGNVMLAPTKGVTSGVRAVITDFGLARRIAHADTHAASISATGDVAGTPAYMAPEQVEGKQVSSAADIYALGIVMYEMVTGKWPFAGDTPFAMAIKRLTEPPSPPRTHVPDLDPKWEAVILRCLAREPSERFASVSEIVLALQSDKPVTLPGVIRDKRRRRRVTMIGAAAFAALMAAATVGYYIRLKQHSPGTATIEAQNLEKPIKQRASIAVLGFKNLSGNPDMAWIPSAFADELSSELSLGEAFRTIPAENVVQMKVNLLLPEESSFSKQTLSRIYNNLGSDLVVLGSCLVTGTGASEQVHLNVVVQDARSGDTKATVSGTNNVDKLNDMVSQLGNALRGKLGVAMPASNQFRASYPSDPEAARLLEEGIAKLRVYDAPAAKDLLQQAVQADPKHPLSHAALASAWSALGYDLKAAEEAKKAFDLATSAPPEQRLEIEGSYYETIRDWGKAVFAYQKLYLLYRDNPEYGLQLAGAQTNSGDAKGALSTIASLRRLSSPPLMAARLDLAEASALELTSDFSGELRLALDAERIGASLGARNIVAKSKSQQGLALEPLGMPKKAQAAHEDAQRAYSELGDRRGVADSLNNVANLLADEGDGNSARTMYEAVFDVFKQLGDQGGMAMILNNSGMLLYDGGNLAEARAKFTQALPIYRKIGNKRTAADVSDNLANAYWKGGDSESARKIYEQALATRREIGDVADVVTSLNNLGNLLREQGELPEAKKYLAEASAEAIRVRDQKQIALSYFNLGEVSRASGDVATARQQYENALAIRKKLGLGPLVAEAQLALTQLAFEAGKSMEATESARQIARDFEGANQKNQEAEALALVAESLLAQQRVDESKKEIERALLLAAKAQDVVARMDVRTIAARVTAASGNPHGAIRDLQGIAAEATRTHFTLHALEGRLVSGEIELKVNPKRARGKLEALQHEAEIKGCGLIARKAAAILGRSS